MIDKDIINILVCPETKKTLKLAEQDLIDKVNNLIKLNLLKNSSGEIINEKIDGGLLVVDGSLFYPIREDIPILLPKEAIYINQFDGV